MRRWSIPDRLVRWAINLIKAFIVLLFLGAIGFFFMLKYTENPEFCKTCHYMRPYYESWKSSTHNKVKCIECHYPPGIRGELQSKWTALSQVAKYITGTYGTKPWAEVSDQSCLRSGCHDRRLLQGKVLFKNVIFDHTSHLREMRRGKKLRCTSCHSQIVQGSHLTVTETTCFLCHFKDQDIRTSPLSDCNKCHGAPTKVVKHGGVTFDHKVAVRQGIACVKCHRNVVRGDGHVPRERCFNCHNQPERVEKYGDTFLIHQTHITEHKVECTQCHSEIQHGLIQLTSAIDINCQSCHPNHHKTQKELYMGIGGRGAEPRPDPMFLTSVSCEGCHIEHKGDDIQGYTAEAPPAACMNCHGTKFNTMLTRWKASMSQRLRKILPVLKRARMEILSAKASPEALKRALAKYEDAAFNVKLVRYGKGVHNIAYSEDLLRVAVTRLREAMRLVGSSYQIPAGILPEKVFKSECYPCHYGAENRTVPYRGRMFPHELHVTKQRLPCRSCHANNTDPKSTGHGKLVRSWSSCNACHHKDAQNCGRCHPAYQQFFTGKVAQFPGLEPDVMAQNDVACTDCHLNEEDKVVRPAKTICTNCHDESYPETFTEWKAELQDLQKQIAALFTQLKSQSLNGKQRRKLTQLRRQFKIFQENPSLGIHNYSASSDLLSGLLEELKALQNIQ